MIFLASVQESLSVMLLRPRSDGLSLMTVRAGVGVGVVTTWEGGDSDELDVEGATEEPAQVESAVDGSRVDDDDEGWVST
jgi:hypothetical protein